MFIIRFIYDCWYTPVLVYMYVKVCGPVLFITFSSVGEKPLRGEVVYAREALLSGVTRAQSLSEK